MKWTVGIKIGAGFAVALAILLAIGIASYRATNKLTDTADWVDHTHQVLEALARTIQDLTNAETGQRGYLLTMQESYLEPYQSGTSAVDRDLKDIQELTQDNPIQQQRIAALQPLVAEDLASLKDGIDAVKTKGQDAGKQIIATGKGKQLMDDIRAAVAQMKDEELSLLKVRTDEAQASVQMTRWTIIGGTVGAFVVLSLITFLITQNIARPLKQATSVAEQMAEGNLDLDFTAPPRRDEVGVLLRAFSAMVGSLRNMAQIARQISEGDLRVKVEPKSAKDRLGNAFAAMVQNLQRMTMQVRDGVNVLSSSASQISTSTTQLAAGAAETATAVSQATTTVEEVRQAAQVSSQKSKAVSENARNMTQISQNGAKSTEETISGIGRIRTQMQAIADSTVRLSEQTQTIGQIVASVEDLAAQSNLLAVNASIEAAKAGEQGKGFAVVAQEVRSLAEQSKQATSQVRGILADIQKATSAAVMATEQGGKAVDAGIKQSGLAGQSIQALSDSVTEAAQAATQIAASSQQQLVGVDQVASAMENVKEASRQNAASAKQLEAAVHNLKELGQKLKDSVEIYKV